MILLVNFIIKQWSFIWQAFSGEFQATLEFYSTIA